MMAALLTCEIPVLSEIMIYFNTARIGNLDKSHFET